MSEQDSHDPALWLEAARRDLADADILQRGGGSAHSVCFLSQQAAEKAIKAAIYATGAVAPKQHGLIQLAQLVPGAPALLEMVEELASLTRWIILARYPSDSGEPQDDDAAEARRHATLIVDAVQRHLA